MAINMNMRKYETTHPWISCTLDLRPVPWKVWVLLGEAQSKCEDLAGVPLRPDTAELLHRLYLAKGVLATTAIEGNTLSEDQVIALLKGTLQLPPSKEYLAKEISNIVDACNQIVSGCCSAGAVGISPSLIKTFNRLVLAGLQLEEGVQPGEIRTYDVGVARYRAAPHEDCAFLLDKLCEWLSSGQFENNQATISFAILKAIVAHVYLAWIHPFGDGNGRTARLVELYFLLNAGVPMPAAHLLSNHYNETRSEYYRQLDATSRSTNGDIRGFIEYATQGFVDGLRIQIEHVRRQQMDVAWINHIHETFHNLTSRSDVRKRKLLLDLSRVDNPVHRDKLTTISPRTAKEYSGKTARTLSRDLKDLQALGLLGRKGNLFWARKDRIQAFLPTVHVPTDTSVGTPDALAALIAPHRHECRECGQEFDCTCPDPEEKNTSEEAVGKGWPIACVKCADVADIKAAVGVTG